MGKKHEPSPFVVYDARYPSERALVMCCCDMLKEAKETARDYGIGTVVVKDEEVVWTVR